MSDFDARREMIADAALRCAFRANDTQLTDAFGALRTAVAQITALVGPYAAILVDRYHPDASTRDTASTAAMQAELFGVLRKVIGLSHDREDRVRFGREIFNDVQVFELAREAVLSRGESTAMHRECEEELAISLDKEKRDLRWEEVISTLGVFSAPDIPAI